eukprot:IDg18757t1
MNEANMRKEGLTGVVEYGSAQQHLDFSSKSCGLMIGANGNLKARSE